MKINLKYIWNALLEGIKLDRGKKNTPIPYVLSKFKFSLGDKVRCKLTGFEGIVISATHWLYNANTHGVRPTGLKDGVPREDEIFDEVMLELVEANVITFTMATEAAYGMGDTLDCLLNGFRGRVTGICFWNTGCVNYSLSITYLGIDNDVIDNKWIEGAALVLIDKNTYDVIDNVPVTSGGPVDSCRSLNRA